MNYIGELEIFFCSRQIYLGVCTIAGKQKSFKFDVLFSYFIYSIWNRGLPLPLGGIQTLSPSREPESTPLLNQATQNVGYKTTSPVLGNARYTNSKISKNC